jgi:hypothetical protein
MYVVYVCTCVNFWQGILWGHFAPAEQQVGHHGGHRSTATPGTAVQMQQQRATQHNTHQKRPQSHQRQRQRPQGPKQQGVPTGQLPRARAVRHQTPQHQASPLQWASPSPRARGRRRGPPGGGKERQQQQQGKKARQLSMAQVGCAAWCLVVEDAATWAVMNAAVEVWCKLLVNATPSFPAAAAMLLLLLLLLLVQ